MTELHLAVALDGYGWHPQAWRYALAHNVSANALLSGRYWAELALTAERGLLDFVSIDDSLHAQAGRGTDIDPRRCAGRADAVMVAASIAPATTHIGLVPTATVTHTEPFHVSKSIATLDYVSHGRAGWQPRVSVTEHEAALFGRRGASDIGSLFDEAADVVEVVRRLWDSWEDDAVIRDVDTGRFIDRDKLHHIDFVGRYFSVKGPSITPRPPQGQPVVAALAHAPLVYQFAATSADVVFITPHDEHSLRSILGQVAEAKSAAGGPLLVYADLVVSLASDPLTAGPIESDACVFTGSAAELADLVLTWHDVGVDGVRLRPAVNALDLTRIVDDVVPLLQRAGRFRTGYRDGETLRDRLGLAPALNRYAQAAAPRNLMPRHRCRRVGDHVGMSVREGKHRKQIHLAGYLPGVNNMTVWSDPSSGSQIEFSSFVHMARTAERGLFDFFFLAEGLRLREHRGRIHDLDVVGRPDTFTVLAALAAVTHKIGLAGTINTTFNEPYEVARQFATLDHLSDGRAAWNIVTSSDAFIGENFRRGGLLEHADRYRRAEEFITVARKFWDSWAPDAVVGDVDKCIYADPSRIHTVEHHGSQFDVRGVASMPAGPQAHPVLIQAGDSSEGRDFGAKHVDALFTMHGSLEAGQRYYADVKARAAAFGRDPDGLKVLPGATFALGETPEEARENAEHIRRQQVSGPTAIVLMEQVWGRDLSGCDPDGPFPDIEPAENSTITQGRVQHGARLALAESWRARAKAENLSIRELMIEMHARQQFVGTPSQVAEQMDRHVQSDACDGFVLAPHLTPHGLDEFVDKVVPELQERGAFRTEYVGNTLREHLGLTPIARAAARQLDRRRQVIRLW